MKQSDTHIADSVAASAWETVNRVVFPVKDADLTLPLYAVEWTRPHVDAGAQDVRVNQLRVDTKHMNRRDLMHLLREGAADASAPENSFTCLSRTELEVHKGGHVSLCTYFNAFPASYWRRWTAVSHVRFVATAEGKGKINLFRSNGRGLITPAGSINIDADAPTAVSGMFDMKGLMDGGFFWFDAQAATDSALTVSDAGWQVPVEERRAKNRTTLSIAITTFNRAPYCMNQLKAIAGEASVRERLDTIYCTDQGTDLVRNQPDFDAVAKDLGSQLTYLRQGNLGGSGGFSRGMYETCKAGNSEYVLLLDDDAISEPEAIVRAVQFADYAKRPLLVGGGMLHLDNRTVLWSQGEDIDGRQMPLRNAFGSHDFATNPLRDSPECHQRFDAQYNGWWMCLIPTSVIREIGLAIPVFIKYDDIDYAFRAKEHGYPTVSLPGVAVWHQGWHDKDISRTWEEYFMQRNRWIFALRHNPEPSRTMPVNVLSADINMGLHLVYSGIGLHHRAIQDLLRGPQYIIGIYSTAMASVRKLRSTFPDSQAVTDFDEFPEPRRRFVSPSTRPTTSIRRAIDCAVNFGKAMLLPRDGRKSTVPDVAVPTMESTWNAYNGVDSALVTSPDGNSVTWMRRDDRLFRRDINEALHLSSELRRNWKRLHTAYSDPRFTSFETWERIFKENPAQK
ncbi:glycosyltransferase [uncultured Bifidobacterium sp.]|uniref:glycosyltransferase n=1 Tax=uncultured Bifidobacterium sp. TaxID=165187 RepID=UPI002639D104|nr:glycosyltransferase [uncultured Bifidobacterium sp.]